MIPEIISLWLHLTMSCSC